MDGLCVYKEHLQFLPSHLERIKSAINQLPDPKTFLVSSLTSIASADESEVTDILQEQVAHQKQANTELMEQLAQQNEEMIEEMKQEVKEQKEQIKELMNMLQQRTT